LELVILQDKAFFENFEQINRLERKKTKEYKRIQNSNLFIDIS
jgi:hypothetical protein